MLPMLAEALNGHALVPDGRERIPAGVGGPRCGGCASCDGSAGRDRRCFRARAAAAAEAGHAGAQVASMGWAAAGARLATWWPADRAW